MTDFSQLAGKTEKYLSSEKVAVVKAAFEYAMKAHEGQLRRSGGPYLEHPLQVALTMADLQLDTSTLAAALLHDVVENCDIPISGIEANFGLEIAKLVDGVTKLGKLSLQTPKEVANRAGSTDREQQAENLRKMLVSMAEDLRVVFIKLADRLHNMQTLDALAPDKQLSIAQETAEVYAPLAHRLGIWELKWQLEDLSYRYLDPKEYQEIAKLVAAKRTQRENSIDEMIQIVSREFKERA